jgi:hypothetical protein
MKRAVRREEDTGSDREIRFWFDFVCFRLQSGVAFGPVGYIQERTHEFVKAMSIFVWYASL